MGVEFGFTLHGFDTWIPQGKLPWETLGQGIPPVDPLWTPQAIPQSIPRALARYSRRDQRKTNILKTCQAVGLTLGGSLVG